MEFIVALLDKLYTDRQITLSHVGAATLSALPSQCVAAAVL